MILVTGAAGFIGYHTCRFLLGRGERIIGVDNVNEYYDPDLKRARLEQLRDFKDFSFFEYDLCDYESLTRLFNDYTISRVCHLAAQAGVRYSLTNPFAYQKSNGEGCLNVMEAASRFKV